MLKLLLPFIVLLVLVGATPGIADPGERAARQAADAALADRIEAIGAAAFLAEWSDKPIIATQKRIPEPWRGRMVARKAAHHAAGLAGSLRGMGPGTMVSRERSFQRRMSRIVTP